MNEDDIKYDYTQALIIDDELDTCLLLGMLLKKFGIRSLMAHTLTTGLETLQHEKPQLIFLDNNLPDGTGIEHIKQLKGLLPEVTLIMISAISSLKTEALILGADGFIEKPLDLSKIKPFFQLY